MTELLNALTAGANLVPNVLMAMVILYWITVIIGLVDLSFLHFEVDGDAHVELDGDAHFEKHLELNPDKAFSVDWLNSALSFFNLGHVPFMIWLSFLVLPMWFISLVANRALGNTNFLIGLVLLVPILFVSLFLAKVFTTPFVKLFSALNRESGVEESALGKMCTVTIEATEGRIGQATVRIDGAPLLLNIRTRTGRDLPKGAQAIVMEFLEHEKCYLVEPFEVEI